MAANAGPEIKEYLVAHGGPFYELQRQFGLLREDAFRAGPRALLFVAVAWGVPLLLSLFAGHAFGPLAERPYLLDPGPLARFLIAVGIFVLMELQVEQRLRTHLHQFLRAQLISPTSLAGAAEAVADALGKRDGLVAELVCLVLAGILTALASFAAFEAEPSSWRIRLVDGTAALTPAGWWCLLVSGPIFWFLLLRCLWRHHIWAVLLRKIANLDLRLAASHPDGNGGLSFIGRYPNAYGTFVLGTSSVVGAAIANQILHATLSLTVYSSIMAAWLAIVLALFAWPLMAFARPLSRIKEETTLLASALATKRTRAIEREVLGRNVGDPDEADEKDKSADIADPAKLYDTAQKLSTFVINREALVPVSAAAIIPLVVAGATQLPIKELIGVAKRLLLL